jgi:hypothetical protein
VCSLQCSNAKCRSSSSLTVASVRRPRRRCTRPSSRRQASRGAFPCHRSGCDGLGQVAVAAGDRIGAGKHAHPQRSARRPTDRGPCPTAYRYPALPCHDLAHRIHPAPQTVLRPAHTIGCTLSPIRVTARPSHPWPRPSWEACSRHSALPLRYVYDFQCFPGDAGTPEGDRAPIGARPACLTGEWSQPVRWPSL